MELLNICGVVSRCTTYLTAIGQRGRDIGGTGARVPPRF